MFTLIYTIIILVILIIALAKDVFRPSLLILAALLLLIIGDVITIDEGFSGFSNKGMITVGFLFVVSGGLRASGKFQSVIVRLLGKDGTSPFTRYIRLLFPVAGFSAFLNNTPIVASLIPVIKNWAKSNDLPVSKYLIPVSFAAILGGMCTLIGTSTNLVVHGMLLDAGFNGFSFFELTKIGLPAAGVGLLFIALAGWFLLPKRKEITAQLGESTREFVVELKVDKDYPFAQKTVEEANLRHLKGLFLFQITRGDHVIAPVSPSEKIYVGDRLFFTGLPETIFELQKTTGLKVVKDPEFDVNNIDSDKLNTYEAVVSGTSPLIGQTVRDSNFRTRYNGVILAIHRAGSRINKKIGDIVFRPNDTLFILAEKGFEKKWYHARDFSLVSRSLDIYEKPRWKGNLALGIIILMVVFASLKIMPILLSAAVAAILMVVTGILSSEDAKKNVNWNVLLYIACSFGIAKAVTNSGIADGIAGFIVNSLRPFGPAVIAAGIFVLTSLFTWVISNNAVAAIMFPVVLSVSRLLNTDPRPFMLALVFAASTCFASPLGYQTNLMVYNAGNYKFTDFLKIGLILNILIGTVVTLLIYFYFFSGNV